MSTVSRQLRQHNLATIAEVPVTCEGKQHIVALTEDGEFATPNHDELSIERLDSMLKLGASAEKYGCVQARSYLARFFSRMNQKPTRQDFLAAMAGFAAAKKYAQLPNTNTYWLADLPRLFKQTYFLDAFLGQLLRDPFNLPATFRQWVIKDRGWTSLLVFPERPIAMNSGPLPACSTDTDAPISLPVPMQIAPSEGVRAISEDYCMANWMAKVFFRGLALYEGNLTLCAVPLTRERDSFGLLQLKLIIKPDGGVEFKRQWVDVCQITDEGGTFKYVPLTGHYRQVT